MQNSISDIAKAIRTCAQDEGFDVVRIAKADVAPDAVERLDRFVAEGRHGTMDWLARDSSRRADPKTLWPDARPT